MCAIMIERTRGAMAANLLLTEINIDSLWINFDAGVADGGQDASPVGIGPGPGRFHKRRVGYRAANLPRFTPRPRLFDIEPYHVGYAFTIGHDLSRQRAANFCQRGLKFISH